MPNNYTPPFFVPSGQEYETRRYFDNLIYDSNNIKYFCQQISTDIKYLYEIFEQVSKPTVEELKEILLTMNLETMVENNLCKLKEEVLKDQMEFEYSINSSLTNLSKEFLECKTEIKNLRIKNNELIQQLEWERMPDLIKFSITENVFYEFKNNKWQESKIQNINTIFYTFKGDNLYKKNEFKLNLLEDFPVEASEKEDEFPF
ncbi:MAG: hypothetical protein ABIP51_15220 [Bacteroidia bacterium]